MNNPLSLRNILLSSFQGINTTSVGHKYGSFNVGKFASTSNGNEQLAIDFSEISEVEHLT